MIKIRLAQIYDTTRLCDLSEVTFRDTYSAFNTAENMDNHVATKFTFDVILHELQNPDYQYIVIENEGNLIGFAKLVFNHAEGEIDPKESVEVERFYVLKGFHGQNLGRKLMDFCCEWSVKKGFKTIWLGVWEHNPNAIAFYERMGFDKYGNHVFVLGEDVQNDYLVKKGLI